VRIVDTAPKLASLTFIVNSDLNKDSTYIISKYCIFTHAECFLPPGAFRILEMNMTIMMHDLLVNMWLHLLLRMNDRLMRATCRVYTRSLTIT
jgi:hypothetical protein